MLDIGWSELMVVAVVLIVIVGPKDLPRMLRTFGRFTTQLRSMASEFRSQFDEALKEAELDEVRKAADDVRKLDPRKDIRAAMNPMKAIGDEIRSSLKTASESSEPTVPSPNAGAEADAPVKTGTNGSAGPSAHGAAPHGSTTQPSPSQAAPAQASPPASEPRPASGTPHPSEAAKPQNQPELSATTGDARTDRTA